MAIAAGVLGVGGIAYGIRNQIKINKLSGKVEALSNRVSVLKNGVETNKRAIKNLAASQEQINTFVHQAVEEIQNS